MFHIQYISYLQAKSFIYLLLTFLYSNSEAIHTNFNYFKSSNTCFYSSSLLYYDYYFCCYKIALTETRKRDNLHTYLYYSRTFF